MARATLSDMDTKFANETASLKSLRTYARAKGLEENVVVGIYEEEFTDLDRRARVKKYVPLLAEKHTKDRLRAS